jgi:hypothetical protein
VRFHSLNLAVQQLVNSITLKRDILNALPKSVLTWGPWVIEPIPSQLSPFDMNQRLFMVDNTNPKIQYPGACLVFGSTS